MQINASHFDLHGLQAKYIQLERSVTRGSTSGFEWVDSVLVKSIVEGEWAVFENANLCNPSILDRLNPLLEEGNHSLCINEQGLVEGDQMRDIKAHPQFRSIFVIDSHTLFDLGKDVSRALKNRCLQITINYSQESLDTI
jgi:midasin